MCIKSTILNNKNMKIQISSFLYLLCLLLSINSNKFLKSNIQKTERTCNYSYLNNRDQTTPTQQNKKILGNAAIYAVLAGSSTDNSGSTTIVGSLGVSPSTAIDGTAVTLIGGTLHAGDPHALEAKNSLKNAYNHLKGLPPGKDLTGTDLVGLTLRPGQYGFTSSAFLSAGILTLDANGDKDAEWVFQITSTLITSVGAEVKVIGGGSPFNVYWQVGSSATIEDHTKMVGNIVAYSHISLGVNATLIGRALARVGFVRMDSNFIASVPCKRKHPFFSVKIN